MIRQHLMVAHDIWKDLGEQEASLATITSAPNVTRILERRHFDLAAMRAYQNSNARVFEHQYEAIRHASLDSFRRHAIVNFWCWAWQEWSLHFVHPCIETIWHQRKNVSWLYLRTMHY